MRRALRAGFLLLLCDELPAGFLACTYGVGLAVERLSAGQWADGACTALLSAVLIARARLFWKDLRL